MSDSATKKKTHGYIFAEKLILENGKEDEEKSIRKAVVFCKKVRSEEKESNANRLIKRMAKIPSILGVQ